MMKLAPWMQLVALATASYFTFVTTKPTTAANFESSEVDQSYFIAVAAPYGTNRHQLLVLEQISSDKQCWQESGNAPVSVEPLLLQFDFTGICGRSTDSNGYSIRLANEDIGWKYQLRLIQRNGELVLIGTPTKDPNAPVLEIGRTYGMTNRFDKIVLNPGWRFTKRMFDGKKLGHVYLTNDSTLAVLQTPTTRPQPLPVAPQVQTPTTRPQPIQVTPRVQTPTVRPQPLPVTPRVQTPTVRPQSLPVAPQVQTPTTRPQPIQVTPRVQTPTTRPQPIQVTPRVQTPTVRPQPLPPVPPGTLRPSTNPQGLPELDPGPLGPNSNSEQPVLEPGTELIFIKPEAGRIIVPNNSSQPLPPPPLLEVPGVVVPTN